MWVQTGGGEVPRPGGVGPGDRQAGSWRGGRLGAKRCVFVSVGFFWRTIFVPTTPVDLAIPKDIRCRTLREESAFAQVLGA